MSHPKGINARQHPPAATLARPRTIPTTGGESPPTLTTTATLGRVAGLGDRQHVPGGAPASATGGKDRKPVATARTDREDAVPPRESRFVRIGLRCLELAGVRVREEGDPYFDVGTTSRGHAAAGITGARKITAGPSRG
jgi:hypothetical protein